MLNRVGLVCRKAGMSVFYTESAALPVTILSVEQSVVLDATERQDGLFALSVGYLMDHKNISKPMLGIAKKHGVTPFKKRKQWLVSKECVLPTGSVLLPTHFAEGQHVDIKGVTIGKGFAGGVKRHGFKTQDASHGNSLSHRAIGSTGCRQDPGKVFKNKKMPGRMGGVNITMQNLKVVKVDLEHNIILLSGSVPGKPGSLLFLSDAKKKPLRSDVPLPGSYRETKVGDVV